MCRLKSSFVSALKTQHTYLDSELVGPVFCFEELVETGLWRGEKGWVKHTVCEDLSIKQPLWYGTLAQLARTVRQAARTAGTNRTARTAGAHRRAVKSKFTIP
jgi:hypothetical protein